MIREKSLFACISIITLAFIIQSLRLWYIVNYQGMFLSHYSNRQCELHTELEGFRGKIYDRNGILLAGNRQLFSAFCVPNSINKELKNFLKQEYPASYKKIESNPNAVFCFIKRFLSSAEEQKLREKRISGIHFLPELSRYYPISETSHIVGLVDLENKGLCGIELSFDSLLKGERNSIAIKKDASQKIISQNITLHKKNYDLQLTIDAHLQFILTQELQKKVEEIGAREAYAVVMDVKNGDIIAMPQVPFYNVNDGNNEVRALNTIDIIGNKNIKDAYEIGSAIKAFCMLAAIKEDVVKPEEIIDCKNSKEAYVNKYLIKTAFAQGKVPFSEVIKKSNNIGMVQIGLRLGKKLFDHYTKLEFGKKTGIELPGEASGYVNPPKKWSNRSIYSLSFGYELSTTLLQIATAWSVFASKGNLVRPRITLNKSIIIENKYEKEVIETCRSLLKNIDTDKTKIFLKEFPDCLLYGKTGTANILENKSYNTEKNTYIFVGNIEYKDINYIIAVYFRESKLKNVYASTIALPCFLDFSRIILSRYEKTIFKY